MTKNWKLWLGLLISAIALYFTFRDIQLDELARTLATAQVAWLAPACVVLFLTLLLRAWRWAILMANAPYEITWHALNIGYMLNMILPLRLGEIGRAYVIGERTSVRMTRALSTVVFERALDLAAVVLLFAFIAQFIPMPPEFARAALTGAIIIVLLLGLVGILIWQSARVEMMLKSIAQHYPKLRAEMLIRRFRDIQDGFGVIHSPRKLAAILVLTAGIWVAQLVVTSTSMAAFMPPRLDEAGLVLVATNLGGALPSAPGGLGVVQYFAMQSLVIPFHVPEESAVAYAFVGTLFQEVALIILGFIGLVRVGMSFSSVTSRSQQVDTRGLPAENGDG